MDFESLLFIAIFCCLCYIMKAIRKLVVFLLFVSVFVCLFVLFVILSPSPSSTHIANKTKLKKKIFQDTLKNY